MNDEDRAEAERLKLIPRSEQRAIIALHRAVAADTAVSDENRREARRRAKALETLLNLEPKKRKS